MMTNDPRCETCGRPRREHDQFGCPQPDTTKLDLRTAPIGEVCEWCAVNVMGWKDYWFDESTMTLFCGLKASSLDLRSLDAVAAVEQKAREKWLKWARLTVSIIEDGPVMAQWWGNHTMNLVGCLGEAPTEPEARLRAVCLAVDRIQP